MLYVIPDTLLKVSLNTNKTGHLMFYVIPDTLLKVLINVSGITYNMVTSFIGVYRHSQQCVRYKVKHGDQFYWCLTRLSTMYQV
jgi:hypothetical protein